MTEEMESSVRFLALVSQVSGPTQALSERANALLLTVGMIVKETATERQHFRRSNYSLLQIHDECGTPPFT